METTDFSKLNNKQRMVTETLNENILLIASAGTGKTNTLAYRISNILDKGLAEGNQIACLTFTNKACSEMKKRVEAVAGSAGLKVVIKTFHGFCLDIVQTEAKKGNLSINTDTVVLDEEDCLEIIKKLSIYKRGFEKVIQSLIGLFKEYRGEYGYFSDNHQADYQKTIIRLLDEKAQRVMDASRVRFIPQQDLVMEFHSHGGELIFAYDNLLRDEHAIDFNDIINMAANLLNQNEIQKYWQSKYSFWNVDEVQDTSRLEYSILTKLFGDSNVLICGDFFQTIYQWRGSDPDFIQNSFERDYFPSIVVFNENYRSTDAILNSSYQFLERYFPDKVASFYTEAAKAVQGIKGEPLIYRVFNSVYIEADWIYHKLQELKPPDLSRVCILTRSNQYNKRISEALEKIIQKRTELQIQQTGKFNDYSLNFMLVDEFKFYRRQEIKDVLAFLRIIVNEWDTGSLKRVIQEYMPGVGKITLDKLDSEEYKLAGIRLTDTLHPSTIKYGDPFEMLLRELENGNVVVFDVESTGLDTTNDEIIQLAAIRIDIHGNELDRYVSYVKASKSVGKSEHTHHISDEMLSRLGKEPKQALAEFLSFAKGSVVVGHNVGYDLAILDSQLKRLNMPKLECLCHYDTMDIFRRFYPNLLNHKLEYLGNYCHVSHKSTHDAFDDICATGEILIYAVVKNIVPGTDKRRSMLRNHVKPFINIAAQFNRFRELAEQVRPSELIGHIVNELGVKEKYLLIDERNNLTGKSNSHMNNLRQMYCHSKGLDNLELSPLDAIRSLLSITTLSNTEFDLSLTKHPKIPIITVHQAKGLEFDQVFLAGLQEGCFPSKFSLEADDLEEEARLFYVAITRARLQLFMSSALERNSVPCRFINSLPKDLIDSENKHVLNITKKYTNFNNKR